MAKTLGDFEYLILLAIVRLADDAYGATIHREIEDRTTRTVAIGAVYTGLARLERQGFVSARVGEPTAERGGRRRKYYAMTAAGAEALVHSYDSHRQMTAGLERTMARLRAAARGGR